MNYPPQGGGQYQGGAYMPPPDPNHNPQGGKRPGGLTALAVLNFVFAGLGILGYLALLALVSAADTVVGEASGGTESLGAGKVYIVLIIGLITVALMLVAGIGYLKQSKFLGYKLGNAYAILSIFNTVLSLVLLKQGFGAGSAIGLVYPILTLALLNTSFKNSFIR